MSRSGVKCPPGVRGTLLLLGVFGLLAGACGGSAKPRSSGPPSGSTSSPPRTAPLSSETAPSTSGGEKPLLTGLIVMPPQNGIAEKGESFPTADPGVIGGDASAFSGIAIDVDWSQLEPAAGHYDWAPVDDSLAAVTRYNHAHPADPLRVKFRVFPGFAAPDWAKSTGGPPLAVPTGLKGNGPTNTIGRWWTPAYEGAWSAFQHALAGRYDTNPLVGGVQVTSCSTESDEPFIVSKSEFAAMKAAGLTESAYESCLEGAFQDYSGWHDTPIYYPINVLPGVKDGAPFAEQIAKDCATSVLSGGPRCVIDNHALGNPRPKAGDWLYTTIDQLYQQYPKTTVVAFQTYSATKGGSCPEIDAAIDHHASSIELWQPVSGPSGYVGFAAMSQPTLAQWSTALKQARHLAC